jgi:hypothetical protein
MEEGKRPVWRYPATVRGLDGVSRCEVPYPRFRIKVGHRHIYVPWKSALARDETRELPGSEPDESIQLLCSHGSFSESISFEHGGRAGRAGYGQRIPEALPDFSDDE